MSTDWWSTIYAPQHPDTYSGTVKDTALPSDTDGGVRDSGEDKDTPAPDTASTEQDSPDTAPDKSATSEDSPADSDPGPDSREDTEDSEDDSEDTGSAGRDKPAPRGATRLRRAQTAVRRHTPAPRYVQRMPPHIRARWRAALYNGAAAATGWGLGGLPLAHTVVYVAEYAPASAASITLAAATGYGAWQACRRWLPVTIIGRLIGTTVAATLASAAGPAAVNWLTAHHIPAFVLPVACGAVTCGAVALLIDRPTRRWWPPLAWFLRIPLATTITAFLIYSSPWKVP